MRPLKENQLAYIQHRIDGLCRKWAYHKAYKNFNMKSCEKSGSRMEIDNPHIAQLIKAGITERIRAKQQIIEDREREIYRDHIAKKEMLADLLREKQILAEQEEKLKNAPRDDSHLDVPENGLPTLAQCGGTVRGYITQPPKQKRSNHWNVYND